MINYCPNCGTEITSNAKFCEGCGKNINFENDENLIINEYNDKISELQIINEKLNKDKKAYLVFSIFLLCVIVFMFVLLYMYKFG